MSWFARMLTPADRAPLQKAGNGGGNPNHAANGLFASAPGSGGPKVHPEPDDHGKDVTIQKPTEPENVANWQDASAAVTFTPGHAVPGMSEWKSAPSTKSGWEALAAQTPLAGDGPPKSTGGKMAAGVIIKEPDGRLWLCEPTNHFGGYEATFPKGTVDPGMSLDATAMKEAYEETGLQVKLTAVLGDFQKTTSTARFYLAERVGGSPEKMGWESQSMRLVSPEDAKKLLNVDLDHKILDAAVNASPAPAPAATPAATPAAKPAPTPSAAPVAATPAPSAQAPAAQQGNGKWTKVTGQKGSNPGGIYADPNGEQHYVKFYANPQQARTEQLASSLFEDLGVRTPSPKVQEIDGKEALVTKWNPNLERLKPADFGKLNDTQKLQVAKMYLGAVLTKNWDVVGLDHDNIVMDKTTRDMVEVDTGGAMEFRAQGSHKDYGEDIAEHASLLDPKYPAGQVFSTILKQSPGMEQKAMDAVKSLDLKSIRDKFKASGLTNQADLFHSFKKRRQALLAKGGLGPD